MSDCIMYETKEEEIGRRLLFFQRTWAEIDLDEILNNIAALKRGLSPEVKIMAVIKMDGYGHGAEPIAVCLEQEECVYGFAVATVEEALALRRVGIKKPILVLGYTFPCSYEQLVKEDIIPTVFRDDSVDQLAAVAGKHGIRMKVHVKVDTGMSRIGVSPDEEGIAFIRRVGAHPELEIQGIFTHFARADENEKEPAYLQLKKFTDFVKRAEEELGYTIPIRHCANSAAVMEMPDAAFEMVRGGIAIYGLYPSDEMDREKITLRPALSWYSKVVYVKKVHAGQPISYGGTYVAPSDMSVATIPVGYGDGYPRGLSSKGEVLICGKRAPILGRVCMDQFMVDVTHIPQVCEGDKVTLIGRDADEQITAEKLGDLSGRFHYELVCCIGNRVPRVYMRNGKPVAIKDYLTS